MNVEFTTNLITACAVFGPATIMFFGFLLANKHGRLPVYIVAPIAAASVILGAAWIRTYWGADTQFLNDLVLIGAMVIWAAGGLVGWLLAKRVS